MDLVFREATAADVPEIINMLASDSLGKQREVAAATPDDLESAYLVAFDEINEDPNNRLAVVESDGRLAGVLQITFIPYLTYGGSWRCMIEGVRVHRDFRGKGLMQPQRQCGVDLGRCSNAPQPRLSCYFRSKTSTDHERQHRQNSHPSLWQT